MSEEMGERASRLEGLRREYIAGRIDANAYIIAGGDPDTVQAVEASSDASSHSLAVKVLQGGAAIVAVLLLLVGIGQLFTEMRSFLLALLLWAAAFSLLLLIQKV